MKSSTITLGTLWYDIIQTAPKTFEYFLYDESKIGRIIREEEMDDFVDKHRDFVIDDFEVDYRRSLLYVKISKNSYSE